MGVGLHPGTVKTDLGREFWESTPKVLSVGTAILVTQGAKR